MWEASPELPTLQWVFRELRKFLNCAHQKLRLYFPIFLELFRLLLIHLKAIAIKLYESEKRNFPRLSGVADGDVLQLWDFALGAFSSIGISADGKEPMVQKFEQPTGLRYKFNWHENCVDGERGKCARGEIHATGAGK